MIDKDCTVDGMGIRDADRITEHVQLVPYRTARYSQQAIGFGSQQAAPGSVMQ